jgi:tetratricopeptide (TPR) repeat protein
LSTHGAAPARLFASEGAGVSFSIRKLLRSGSTDVRASGDIRRAQAFIDRGIAAERSGNATKALESFRRAVEADDRFAPAHLNLGIALQAAGALTAAIASYERAIALDPQYAAAHYNLARTQLLRSRHAEAETRFRVALQCRDDFPEAWVGLASALEALGRDEDALSALNKAIGLRSDYVGALLNSLALLRKLERTEDVVKNSRRVLELEPENYLAHATLGMGLHALGQLSDAETSYRLALTFNPGYAEARANLASLLQAGGRTREAIPLLLEVVASDPENARLRRLLAEALLVAPLNSAGAKERGVLVRLCLDDDLLASVIPSIHAVIKNDAGFPALQESARRGEDPFTAETPAIAAFLREPLLLAALPRMQIMDAPLEQVLTHIRRCILLRFESASGAEPVDPAVPGEFICALARHCFCWGYALFADEEDELRQLDGLRQVVEGSLAEAFARLRTLESSLRVAALYGPLHTLKGCERLLEYPVAEWSEAFRPLVQEQIANRRREREIATQITAITRIDDAISRAVRTQYEENPYPRWVTFPGSGTDSLEKLLSSLRPGKDFRLRARPFPVLIAGCGTGRDPISFAKVYPDSHVLAVDLSLASLAYAARMTEQLGIPNITYRQADILKLGALDARFAVVECLGVLHHLGDPIAGWRTLLNLLEPDGLMRIALYSEKARRVLRGAQEFARSHRFPPTPEGIRRCRRAIMELPDGHPARDALVCGDFYSLDGCRDLLMNVQEHQFTLPRLEQCLEELGLQFLRIECATATWNRFRTMFPGSEAEKSLSAWDQFEDAHPETFLGMYFFWCCRK